MTQVPFQDVEIPMGTKFTVKRPNYMRDYTVIDLHKTYNVAGELVKTRYVCKGYLATDYDMVKVTIQRALMREAESK